MKRVGLSEDMWYTSDGRFEARLIMVDSQVPFTVSKEKNSDFQSEERSRVYEWLCLRCLPAYAHGATTIVDSSALNPLFGFLSYARTCRKCL